ncbi:MAG: hypothetical protein ACI309_04125 [Candidatus Limisoma sp.]|nr:hypothetical protein [Bacteroidales bacterium]MDD6621732.1 hypothetical protein [Bacteroidales bacterium]
MSYSRNFSTTIAVHYSGSVSYPASEHGGSVSYSGTAYETVNVEVRVDTDPFDASVAQCNRQINGLTASVGAMNAAQCANIAQNANRVSDTIINGFFQSVRTDLSTQKAMLEQTINAKLMLLRQQADTLREKQRVMQENYARTSARYQKIFEDLNNELATRIQQLDQPVFRMAHTIDRQSDRMLHTDMIQTAVTANTESATLQSQIAAATVKNHALQAMTRATDFLMAKARTELTMQKAVTEGNGNDAYLLPVCIFETESEGSRHERTCHIPGNYDSDGTLARSLGDRLAGEKFSRPTDDEDRQLRSYVQNEIAENITASDSHSERVRQMINKLLNY